jgi:hypothetical protein
MDGHEGHQQPEMADSIQERYWLYRWMDDQGVRSIKDFNKAIRKPNLIDVLSEYSAATTVSKGVPSRAVIPSRKIDLSGSLSCGHSECLIAQVQSLFSRTWHYFDTLVIDGPLVGDLRRAESFTYALEHRVRLLLYLRKIGAERHVAFSRKVAGYCSQHFREYAVREHLGLDVLLDTDFEDAVVQKLDRESSVQIRLDEDGDWSYMVRYGDMNQIWRSFSHSDPSKQPSKEDVLRDFFGDHCSALISDVSAARNLQLPLLQPAEELLLEYAGSDSNPMDRVVALQLRLPVLINVPVKEVLYLRQKYSAEFDRFRTALQAAVKEQLARNDTESPEVVARAVIDEYVAPELARIESELNVDRKVLAKKIGANVAVAGTAVSVGALAGIPLVVAAGVAAIIPAFGPINKYFDDRGGIELSDLYFLWRARVRHGALAGNR